MTSIVYLVGAGPGDPRLLTLRGAEVLRIADVVVYDRLAPPALLDLAPARAELVDAGKAPGRQNLGGPGPARQRRGPAEGGHPFVFGRGGEEALACAEAGIPFEVVPGVSAAIAAPAYAGIPVTHRGLASSVAVVTANLAGGRTPELARLAGDADTLVVLMAAGKVAELCRALVAAGRSPDEPAALVEWATTPRQRSVTATLADLPGLAAAAGIGAPSTLVVGSVVGLAPALEWFGSDASPAATLEAARS